MSIRCFPFVGVFLSLAITGDSSRADDSAVLAALGIPSSAVSAGRGGAGLAQGGDGGDLRRNPALLGLGSGVRFHAARTEWFAEVSLTQFSVAAPQLGGRGAVAITYLGYGELERRGGDPTSAPDGTFSPSEVYVQASYARGLGEGGWFAGASLRGLTQRIDTDRASGVAADIGLLFAPEAEWFALGAGVRHIGPAFGPGDDALPLSGGLGARVTSGGGWPVTLRTIADIEAGPLLAPELRVGLEADLSSSLTLRLGKNFGVAAEGVAAGFDYEQAISEVGLGVGYAFTDLAFELGSVHRFDLTLRF